MHAPSKQSTPVSGMYPQNSRGAQRWLHHGTALVAAVGPGVGMGAEEGRTQHFLFLTTAPQPRQGRHSPFPNFLNSGWSHVEFFLFETVGRSIKYHANGKGFL